MPNPKRRHSNSRTGKRRSHDHLRKTTLVVCDHCHNLKPAHQVCPRCGYYRGRLLIPPKEKKQEK
ncbi:MAG: 50S ribosomal protein L32 [Candidatus Omnitrophica bacterium]|nr:50S ribosomal protein L32 [Candidatus Omnitrophota bacterium]